MATFTISTKPSKMGAAVKTALTVNDTGVSRDQLLAMATSFAVVKRQGHWRKHGIPASETINLTDMAPSSRQASGPITLDGIKSALPTFTPEQKAALLAELTRK